MSDHDTKILLRRIRALEDARASDAQALRRRIAELEGARALAKTEAVSENALRRIAALEDVDAQPLRVHKNIRAPRAGETQVGIGVHETRLVGIYANRAEALAEVRRRKQMYPDARHVVRPRWV